MGVESVGAKVTDGYFFSTSPFVECGDLCAELGDVVFLVLLCGTRRSHAVLLRSGRALRRWLVCFGHEGLGTSLWFRRLAGTRDLPPPTAEGGTGRAHERAAPRGPPGARQPQVDGA